MIHKKRSIGAHCYPDIQQEKKSLEILQYEQICKMTKIQ